MYTVHSWPVHIWPSKPEAMPDSQILYVSLSRTGAVNESISRVASGGFVATLLSHTAPLGRWCTIEEILL